MRFVVAVAAFLFSLIILGGPVSAQYLPVEGKSFDASYQILDDESGRMIIRESIVVDFNEPRRGIFRYIPIKFRNDIFKPEVNNNPQIESVTDAQGNDHLYITYEENNNLVVRIGHPEIFLQGEQTYEIVYSVEEIIRHFDDYDELFWDINGEGWEFGFEEVNATFTFPVILSDVGQIDQYRCFSGSFGSTISDCQIQLEQNQLVASAESVRAYENLSVLVSFEQGYFLQPTWSEQYLGVIIRHLGFLLPFVAFPILYLIWSKRGRDPKGRGVIVPEYEPPEKLLPGEVGTIADFSADDSELSATIIDLAIRRYINLIDKSKTERAKKRKYEFELINSDFSKLTDYEKTILNGIFGTKPIGSRVTLDSLKNEFYTTANEAKKQIDQRLIDHMYFDANPKTLRSIMSVIGGLMVFGGLFLIIVTLAWWLGWGVGLIITGILVISFGIAMPKRTHKGVMAKEKIFGLKQYLAIAEADRLKMMQSPDSPYNKPEPEKSVELYEKLLPYAMVLSVEKEWSKKFKDIYDSPPDWYQGSYNNFNAVYLASTLHNGMGHMSSTLSSTPSSSSSSGFSGGGFSGGGFGGGGGGSW